MSDLVPVDPAEALECADDPGAFVVACLERGKTWLAEALEHGDLAALVNVKGYAETLRVATMQKQLGKDAELSAAELVRRAERCIGLGIRAGQAAGEIKSRGDRSVVYQPHTGERNPVDSSISRAPSPTDFATRDDLSSNGTGIYAMTDGVTDEQFEEAILQAKTEKNLARANVVRKARGEKAGDTVQLAGDLAANGHTTAQIAQKLGYSRAGMRDFLRRHDVEVPADAVAGRQRNFDSTRIISATVDAVNGIGMLFDRIDYSALDPNDVNGWLPILNDSIRSLTTLRNRLKEVSQP